MSMIQIVAIAGVVVLLALLLKMRHDRQKAGRADTPDGRTRRRGRRKKAQAPAPHEPMPLAAATSESAATATEMQPPPAPAEAPLDDPVPFSSEPPAAVAEEEPRAAVAGEEPPAAVAEEEPPFPPRPVADEPVAGHDDVVTEPGWPMPGDLDSPFDDGDPGAQDRMPAWAGAGAGEESDDTGTEWSSIPSAPDISGDGSWPPPPVEVPPLGATSPEGDESVVREPEAPAFGTDDTPQFAQMDAAASISAAEFASQEPAPSAEAPPAFASADAFVAPDAMPAAPPAEAPPAFASADAFVAPDAMPAAPPAEAPPAFASADAFVAPDAMPAAPPAEAPPAFASADAFVAPDAMPAAHPAEAPPAFEMGPMHDGDAGPGDATPDFFAVADSTVTGTAPEYDVAFRAMPGHHEAQQFEMPSVDASHDAPSSAVAEAFAAPIAPDPSPVAEGPTAPPAAPRFDAEPSAFQAFEAPPAPAAGDVAHSPAQPEPLVGAVAAPYPVRPAPEGAWWDDEPAPTPSADESRSGRFALGGFAQAASQDSIGAIAFRHPLPSAPTAWVLGPAASPSGVLVLDVQGAINCDPASVEVLMDPGFAPSTEGFTIRARAAAPGPFMVSGTFRVA